MRESDLVLVSHQRATEVDGVIDLLNDRGFSVTRFNLCQYPENECYSWEPGIKMGIGSTISAKAGWFHNPGHYTITKSLDGHGRELSLRECDAFWQGVVHETALRWLNTPDALVRSSRKISQLSQAKALDLPMSPTMVSNDREAVRSFFRKHDGAVTKSLANGYSIYCQERLKLYSKYFSDPPEELLDGLAYSPMIFQKRVQKGRELRVTVVDDRCFGMVAETHGLEDDHIDLRHLDYEAERDRFQGMAVPLDVANWSRDIMKKFGLAYAGLDWIEIEEGNWVFLELNCMGSFKWSELRGAGDITTAIADALTQRIVANA